MKKPSSWAVVAAAVAAHWCVACEGTLGAGDGADDGGDDGGGGAQGGAPATSTSPSSSSSTSSSGAGGSGGAEPEPFFDWGAGVGIAPYHACIIRPDTSVTCFGKHQLRTIPPEGFRAVAIGSGHLHNCAILPPDSEERIGCFGFGDETSLVPPADFAPSQISVGESTNCAVEATGTVSCWYPDVLDAAPPEGFQAKQVSTSAAFSCGIGMDDRVTCWGLNPPELPSADLLARQIIVAQSEATVDPPETRTRHACAVLLDRSVVCWGDDVAGEVSEVPEGLEAVDVALGYTEACAVSVDGDLVCWGQPPDGIERPADVRARSVKISHHNGCALLEDADELVCWGFADPVRYAEGTPDGEEVYVPSR